MAEENHYKTFYKTDNIDVYIAVEYHVPDTLATARGGE
jgi:hypothetical protein